MNPFDIVGEVRISRRGVARLRQGHPWVYRSDVEGRAPFAGLATVLGPEGKPLGTAMVSPGSEITVRMVARGREVFDAQELRRRLEHALARRKALLGPVDAMRVVHGEADLLPGIFVDRYGDCLAVQTTCAAADRLEAEVVAIACELLQPRAVVLRDDVGARGKEGLAQHVTVTRGAAPVIATYHEGELRLEVDLLADQKTGGFLDQSQNHLAAARYARGEALDCFTYHGGFALQLRRAGAAVTAVDQSAPALARARANAERNGLDLELVEADVLELLPRLVADGRRFDVVVLDPPAFASKSRTVDAARRAYKEVNLRGLKLLRPGGVLITCSCSGRVTPQLFDEIIADAARDAQRPVHLLEARAAAADHPVLLGVPETNYLKCRVLMAL